MRGLHSRKEQYVTERRYVHPRTGEIIEDPEIRPFTREDAAVLGIRAARKAVAGLLGGDVR